MPYNMASLAVVTLLLAGAVSKVFQETVGVPIFRKVGGWHYLARMTLSPGKASFDLTVSMLNAEAKDVPFYMLEVVAIPNHLWQAQLQQKCHFSNHSPEMLSQKQQEQFYFPITLNKDSGYRAVLSSSKSIKNQRTYNFILRDCSNSLLKQAYNRKSKIQVHLDIKSNEAHTDAHEACYSWALPLLVLGHLTLIAFIVRKQKEDQGSSHWPKVLIKVSLWIGLSSLSLKCTSHAISNHLSGHSYQIFEVLYILLHSISDYLIIYLLIFLAFGWTVKFTHNYDQQLYIPVASMLGFLHIIIVVMNKVNDSHDKYHMFDTIQAYIMLAFRVVAIVLFVWGIMRSLFGLRNEEIREREHYKHLSLLGGLYLGFVPACFMLIQVVEQEKRQEIMVLAIEGSRLVLNAWLVYLVSSRVSTYRQVVDASFMDKQQKYY